MSIKTRTKIKGKSIIGSGSGIGIAFIIASVVIACLFLYMSWERELSSLENIMFQIFLLVPALVGSYIIGKKTSQTAAYEKFKLHARPAFRRILYLYYGLSRLAQAVEEEIQVSKDSGFLGKFKATITEQFFTVDGALEDWRDIVPEDVEEIEQRLKQKGLFSQRGDLK